MRFCYPWSVLAPPIFLGTPPSGSLDEDTGDVSCALFPTDTCKYLSQLLCTDFTLKMNHKGSLRRDEKIEGSRKIVSFRFMYLSKASR